MALGLLKLNELALSTEPAVRKLYIALSTCIVGKRNFRVTTQYSLSRSYQVNENVIVTLRLVLPMSISNTALYMLFMALSTWSRSVRASMAPHRFYALYDWLFTVGTRCFAM